MPTAKAFSLMTLLHGLGVPELFSPELTAEWEFKLAQMEHGKLKRDDFMREIVAMTEHIVGQAKGYESDTIPGDFGDAGGALPEVRRRGARELQEVPVPVLRVRVLEDHGRTPARASPRPTRCCASGASARSTVSAAGWAGRSRRRCAERRQRGRFRFRRRQWRRRRAEAPDFTRAGAARAVPEMQRAGLRDDAGVRLREGGRPGEDPATSARAA